MVAKKRGEKERERTIDLATFQQPMTSAALNMSRKNNGFVRNPRVFSLNLRKNN